MSTSEVHGEFQISKEKAEQIVKKLRKQGKLGNEITVLIENENTIPQLEKKTLYRGQLLKPDQLFAEMINPVTGGPWKVSFIFEKGFFKEGQVLSAPFGMQTNILHELIKPIPSKLSALPRSAELKERHGEEFVQFLQEKFEGEENLLGLIYEKWQETVDQDIKQYKKSKDDLIGQLEDLSNEVTLNQKSLQQIKLEVEEEQRKKSEAVQQVHDVRVALGLVENTPKTESSEDYFPLEEQDDFFKAVQFGLYHQNGENLVYEYDIVKRFITGLRTDQLVLLTGPSGTGKSSIVQQLGEVLHPCKVHHVAVQSNWTDVQDLLGFFNPLKNTYLPTPFLQAMVDAKNDPETLHIICLDEMNLAHVEYYFSSLLSAREKQPKNRFLDLYAYKFYRESVLELEEMIGKPREFITAEDIEKLHGLERREARSYFELVFDYPAHFPIPENIRFVGTLNMDETVKPLSPKVIDRSFIIELDHPGKLSDVRAELASSPFQGAIKIDVNEFIRPALDEPQLSHEQEAVLQEVMESAAVLRDIPNAMLNSRGMRHMERYLSILTDVDGAADELIISKVLPRVLFSKSEMPLQTAFDNFITKLPTQGSARRKAEKMNAGKRVVQFWR